MAIRRADDTIAVSAWGSGAPWAVEHAPDLLGRGDDWSSFDVSGNEFLAAARHRQPGLRLLRTNTVVAMLVPAIMEQKVTCARPGVRGGTCSVGTAPRRPVRHPRA